MMGRRSGLSIDVDCTPSAGAVMMGWRSALATEACTPASSSHVEGSMDVENMGVLAT